MIFGRLRHHWSRLSWLSQLLFALSLLASTAVTVTLALFLYLFIGGYSVGGNGVVFPAWLPVLIYLGVPCIVLCALMWAGYVLSRRRHTDACHK